jgi:hypothetical protein
MPGSPNTIAVSRRDVVSSPSYQGVAIFDSGIMRQNTDTNFTGGNTIAFGAEPSVLYGFNNEVSTFDLINYSIDASGVSLVSSVSNVIYGFGVTISFDGGTLFASSGAAVNAATSTLLGTYGAYGPMVVDDSINSVAFVTSNSIELFDRDTYVPIASIAVPSTGGQPISATNCGTACIAAVFDSGQIFVVRDVKDTIFANGFD